MAVSTTGAEGGIQQQKLLLSGTGKKSLPEGDTEQCHHCISESTNRCLRLIPLPFSQALGTFSGLSLNTAWCLDSAGRCVLEVVLLRDHEVGNLPERSGGGCFLILISNPNWSLQRIFPGCLFMEQKFLQSKSLLGLPGAAVCGHGGESKEGPVLLLQAP